jgi:pimeloyl-ACP methyl ester carboxylesterase
VPILNQGALYTVAATPDGFNLHTESGGSGTAVVFVHEFNGSCRSFDPQMDAFRPRHRCITFNARGYPPSDVPADVSSYSQEHATADIAAVFDGLGIARAHLVGVSMGAASALQFALAQPARVLSATLVGIGTGSDDPEQFRATALETAAFIESRGMAAHAEKTAQAPTRWRMREKNPAEYRRFVEQLSAKSAQGAANTMRGVQAGRRPLYVHAPRIAAMRLPVLVMVGAEDSGCVRTSEFLGRTLPGARLVVVPAAGHALNQEEPELFNLTCLEFIAGVDAAAAR